MATLGWRILLLVVVGRALPHPSSSFAPKAHSMHRRQTLTDEELLCLLSGYGDANPGNCSQSQPHLEFTAMNCSCAPQWQCLNYYDPADPVYFTTPKCPKPEEVCCDDIDNTLLTQNSSFSPSCGRRNVRGHAVTFNELQNRKAQFGEFPWMAAVLIPARDLFLYICGGSLIHRQVVLTSAHRFVTLTTAELTVRLGEWNTETEEEPLLFQNYKVQELLLHPSYVHSNLAYDVALLILDRPAQLGLTVDTICLPPANYDFKDHICGVSGWGKNEFDGDYQNILKSIDMAVVDHASCESAMQDTRLGPAFTLHDSFLCAGGEEGKDACVGDGGSPLACYKPGNSSKYYQAGVVSWGIGCGTAGLPGVYADVSKAVPWINSIIEERF